MAFNLKRLRLERRVSQEGLAADTGIDRAYVSELERERGNATVDLLDRLAASLDVELYEFFREPKTGAKRLEPLPVGRRPSKKTRAPTR